MFCSQLNWTAISIILYSSRRKFQVCTVWLSCGFEGTGLLCVVLAPGNWSCLELSAGVAMSLPWPVLTISCSTLLSGLLSALAQQCTMAPCDVDVSSGHLPKSLGSSQLTQWLSICLLLLKKKVITRGYDWPSPGAWAGEGLVEESQSTSRN